MKTVLLVPITLTDEKAIRELNALPEKLSDLLAGYWMASQDGFKTLMSPAAKYGWIPTEEALPITDDIVLVTVSGKIGHITLDHCLELASYDKEGWLLETFPEADPKDFTVHAWIVPPEAYGEEGRA